jgi:hypothetical protein
MYGQQLGQLFAGPVFGLGGFGGMFMNDETRPGGASVDFVEAKQVGDETLQGRSVCLEPIDPARHGPAIWTHMVGHVQIWDYLYDEPPLDEAGLVSILEAAKSKPDWRGYAICLPDVGPVGYAFYLNIIPTMGSIEVGNINFAPVLQRTVAATEAMFLMMQAAFEAGYSQSAKP